MDKQTDVVETVTGQVTAPSEALTALLADLPGKRMLILGDAAAVHEAFPTLSAREGDYLLSPWTGDSNLSITLPYEANSVDLVICAHLSARLTWDGNILAEVGRVLHPDARLIVLDYLVPGSRLRGKKAHLQRQAGDYINLWYRLRNSAHQGFLSGDAWQQLMANAAWQIEHLETRRQALDFGQWLAPYTITEKNRLRIQAMLLQAPEKAQQFLTPTMSNARIAFHMTELILAARQANKPTPT